MFGSAWSAYWFCYVLSSPFEVFWYFWFMFSKVGGGLKIPSPVWSSCTHACVGACEPCIEVELLPIALIRNGEIE